MSHPDPKPTVLVVDDQLHVCESLALRLRRQHRVLMATSVDAALEALRAEPVDVIVADHAMPGRSGLEFLRLARDRFPGAGRIMLTGQVTAELAIKAGNEGEVHRFLVKPVDPAELEVAIFLTLERVQVEREDRLRRSLLQASPDLARQLDRAMGREPARAGDREPAPAHDASRSR